MTGDAPRFVSIVLPVYDGEKYLSETIHSVLRQSFQSWELIIVDDGSQDATPEIAGRYRRDHPTRMRLLHHPGRQNRGQFASRVLGAQHASSEVIALIDQDDIWYSNYLKDHLRLWDKFASKGIALSYGPSLYWYSGDVSGQQNFVQPIPEGGARVYKPGELLQCFFDTHYDVTPCPSATLIRRPVLAGLEQFGRIAKDVGAYEDQSMWWMIARDHPILVHDNIWVRYRRHDSNASLSITEEDRERNTLDEHTFLRFMSAQLSRTLPDHPLILTGALRDRIAALDMISVQRSVGSVEIAKTASPLVGMSASYDTNLPTSWRGGRPRMCTIVAQNTGTRPWDASGPYPVRLGVHFGSGGDLPHEGWETDQRFELPHRVEPGGSVTLSVGVTPPARVGGYVMRCRMVAEGIAWFEQIHKTAVTVAAETAPPAEGAPGALAAAYGPDPSGAPTSWRSRQTQVYTVAVTNTGSQSWVAVGPNATRLGVHFGTESDRPNDGWATDQRYALPGDVAPGQTVILVVGVTAPRSPGAYVLRHRMVREGVAWFDQIQKAAVTVRADDHPAVTAVGEDGVLG